MEGEPMSSPAGKSTFKLDQRWEMQDPGGGELLLQPEHRSQLSSWWPVPAVGLQPGVHKDPVKPLLFFCSWSPSASDSTRVPSQVSIKLSSHHWLPVALTMTVFIHLSEPHLLLLFLKMALLYSSAQITPGHWAAQPTQLYFVRVFSIAVFHFAVIGKNC